MQTDPLDLNAIFGEVNHTNTRAQALSNGLLVDVTKTARDAGFRAHVAITAAAWAKAVAWSDSACARRTKPS